MVSSLGVKVFYGEAMKTFIICLFCFLSHQAGSVTFTKEMAGNQVRALYDFNGDGIEDFVETPTSDGFKITWMQNNQEYVLIFSKISADKFRRKILRSRGQGHFIVESDFEFAKNDKGEMVTKSLQDNQEVFYSVNGDEGHRQSLHELYNQTYTCQRHALSGLVDHDGTLAHLQTAVEEVVSTLRSDVSDLLHIDPNCGGRSFSSMARASLQTGLTCLRDMGGNAPALAAQMVAMLRNSESIAGHKVEVQCSGQLFDEQLAPPPGTSVARAAGFSAHQCRPEWPTIVVHPGNAGIAGEPGLSSRIQQGQQRANFFHEMFHSLGYSHGQGQDKTFACTYACFQDEAYGQHSNASERAAALASARAICSSTRMATDHNYDLGFANIMLDVGPVTPVLQEMVIYPNSHSARNILRIWQQYRERLTRANSPLPPDMPGEFKVFILAYAPASERTSPEYARLLDTYGSERFLGRNSIQALQDLGNADLTNASNLNQAFNRVRIIGSGYLTNVGPLASAYRQAAGAMYTLLASICARQGSHLSVESRQQCTSDQNILDNRLRP